MQICHCVKRSLDAWNSYMIGKTKLAKERFRMKALFNKVLDFLQREKPSNFFLVRSPRRRIHHARHHGQKTAQRYVENCCSSTLTQNLPLNNSFSTSLYLNVIFTGLWNLHNVARPRLKSESLVLSRIASEDCSVIDSKAYFVAFQTLMFIIFQGKYSIAFLLFILLTRRSNMIEKERKI